MVQKRKGTIYSYMLTSVRKWIRSKEKEFRESNTKEPQRQVFFSKKETAGIKVDGAEKKRKKRRKA